MLYYHLNEKCAAEPLQSHRSQKLCINMVYVKAVELKFTFQPQWPAAEQYYTIIQQIEILTILIKISVRLLYKFNGKWLCMIIAQFVIFSTLQAVNTCSIPPVAQEELSKIWENNDNSSVCEGFSWTGLKTWTFTKSLYFQLGI